MAIDDDDDDDDDDNCIIVNVRSKADGRQLSPPHDPETKKIGRNKEN